MEEEREKGREGDSEEGREVKRGGKGRGKGSLTQVNKI